MSDRRDNLRRGGFQLPLPPPDEEGGTRVRMSADLTDTTARDVPMLPPDPTARFATIDPAETYGIDDSEEDLLFHGSLGGSMTSLPTQAPTAIRDSAPESEPDREPEIEPESDDKTMVDPHELGDFSDDLPPPPRTVRPPGLPLPAPPTPAQSVRSTIPGTMRARSGVVPEAITNKVRRQPPPPPPPSPRASAPGGPAPEKPARDKLGQDPTSVASDPMSPLKTPLVGGRYRIVQRVGQGGMGRVYKVTHAQLGKTFALKIITDNVTESSKARDLFYREARLASQLSHPNITSVVDFGEDEALGVFMVMEFIEGEPLSKLLHREKRLGVRQACEIIEQVAEALHYIHGKGIVHCDIKTENILLVEVPGTKRRKQQVKLLDFGLARSTSAERQTGSLSGTPHYVAPERIRGEDPTPSADIYGLGILFYELLTGKVPWDGNVAQILCGHLELEPTPPSHLIEGGLDPALEKLILRGLAKTPAQRHKDVAAFLYELRTVMDMLGFGRRSKRGSMRRVVIEKSENKRDEIARAVYDSSRIPIALIARSGLILLGNPAFAKFVMGVTVDVEGLKVQSTPLALAWRTWETDLARASAGRPVRRILELDIAPGETRRLLMWLDPGIADDQAIFGVHPLDE